MWTVEEGKIKLDVKKIRTDFKIISQDGLHLVCPKRNVWNWEEDEKWLRSIIVDDDGFVVSCSWKKFGNYGEFYADTKTLEHALVNNGEVCFSHKEDGSLCIRSVIGDKVILRTRGTLFGGETSNDGKASFGNRFRAVALNKYPKLLDYKWMNDRSLLFEYVSPSNTIVVRYKEDDLIFLGFVIHNSLRIGSWRELEQVTKDGGLTLVKLHNLPRDQLKLLEEIKTWKEEGIVARCADDQVLVKIKSAHYLANHRMKFSMNYSTMVEFVRMGNIQNEIQLVENLQKCDYDWEVIKSAKELYTRYLVACKLKDNYVEKAKDLFSKFCENYPSKDRLDPTVRKEYAKIACSQQGIVKYMMFYLYDGKVEHLDNFCNKIILAEGKVK
jgi:hypothetical protein